MSRDSQNVFKHEVPLNPENTTRYAITIRSVHWKFFNSTLWYGGSNCDKVRFGEGSGTLGRAMPGVVEKAPRLKHIIPEKCASYRNTVVMCGTNELKPQMKNKVISEDRSVIDIYKLYKGKIEDLRRANPRGRLFICPVLPTRDSRLNMRVKEFNRYLFDDLSSSKLDVHIVPGFDDFCDNQGLLRQTLHEYHFPNDVLHINGSGCRILVGCVKNAIQHVKNSRGTGKFTTGKLWSRLPGPRRAYR